MAWMGYGRYQILLAYPGRFVSGIRCYDFYFGKVAGYLVIYRIKYDAVMNISRRDFYFKNEIVSVTYGMRTVRKAFLMLSFMKSPLSGSVVDTVISHRSSSLPEPSSKGGFPCSSRSSLISLCSFSSGWHCFETSIQQRGL